MQNTSVRWKTAVALVALCATAASAQVQDAQQQVCLKRMSKALALVASSQHGNALGCLKAASGATLPSGQTAESCLDADNSGKLAAATGKASTFESASCSPVPDFGFAGAATLSDAGRREDLALVADLFGGDLDAAVIAAASDKPGAKCQALVTKFSGKILQAALGAAADCRSAGLSDGSIDDSAKLENCQADILSDPAGKIAKGAGKLAIKAGKKCDAAALDDSFPGTCAGAADFPACVASAARCHACLAGNQASVVDADCDAIDNGSSDASCCPDADGDGFSACAASPLDCDDGNAAIHPGADELCNAADDDCNGATDDFSVDVGTLCGESGVAPCAKGTAQCFGGALVCTGAIDPATETCNALDDDCDGSSDDGIASAQCRVPVAAPMGASSACQAGSISCDGGVTTCSGYTGPSGMIDGCDVDANCDGLVEPQVDTQNDAANCGACGNVCGAGKAHSNWSCTGGSCVFSGCQAGYVDHDADQSCETPCTFVSAQELCNGIDDNCDGQVDENPPAPSVAQACGTSPNATSAECTSGVTLSCVGGSWQCEFPADVCTGGCSADDEICDGLDNDCDGYVNENVLNYGQPCASDDGLPPPGDGACRTTGTYVCDGPDAVTCSAVKASCASLPGGCTELCDGIDNDCDGLVDESFQNKGSNAANFVKPVVTKIASALWIYSYEASRPSATSVVPGSGNGYQSSAPSGETLDKTRACSVQGKIPWFNVTPGEAEQTCQAMGGQLCSTANWQTACTTNPPSGTTCSWGYAPRGAACTSSFNSSTKYCNLGQTYDFSSLATGDQDGLLTTGSALLKNCWADWSSLNANTSTTNKVYDITGNLREITKNASNDYRLMGGAFNGDSENGGACAFTFYAVDQSFRYYDTGFRCCFTSDPTL